MPDTPRTPRPYLPLLTECLDAALAAGRPVLPAGRRGEAAELLTRLFTDPELFEDYVSDLTDRLQLLGPEAELKLINAPDTDLAVERIVADGFASAPDEVLGDLLTSPSALTALDETQFRGNEALGEWYSEAIARDERTRPDAAARSARATAVVERLSRETAGTDPAGSPPRTRSVASRGWAAAFAALAASVLVGLGWLLRGPDDRQYASVGPMRPGTARGANGDKPPVFEVRNDGPRRLFVTLVGLSPAGPPQVFDRPAGNFLAVEPGASRAVENFDAELRGATAYLAVVTETPAGEVVRALLPESARSAQAGELREKLADGLRGFGHRSPRVDVLTPP